MTATLLKNRLEEGFGIYRVVVPGLFDTHGSFLREFCLTKLQQIGPHKHIPIVIGHTLAQKQKFRSTIDPYSPATVAWVFSIVGSSPGPPPLRRRKRETAIPMKADAR